MLPGIDFRAIELLFWTVMSGPLLLGALATILASSSGAGANVHLSRSRHFLATMIGGVLGCVCLGGVFCVGLRLINSLGEIVLLILLASLSGGLIGYETARRISTKLNWYSCKNCGTRFRSKYVNHQCGPCAAYADRVAVEDALSDFSKHIREL